MAETRTSPKIIIISAYDEDNRDLINGYLSKFFPYGQFEVKYAYTEEAILAAYREAIAAGQIVPFVMLPETLVDYENLDAYVKDRTRFQPVPDKFKGEKVQEKLIALAANEKPRIVAPINIDLEKNHPVIIFCDDNITYFNSMPTYIKNYITDAAIESGDISADEEMRLNKALMIKCPDGYSAVETAKRIYEKNGANTILIVAMDTQIPLGKGYPEDYPVIYGIKASKLIRDACPKGHVVIYSTSDNHSENARDPDPDWQISADEACRRGIMDGLLTKDLKGEHGAELIKKVTPHSTRASATSPHPIPAYPPKADLHSPAIKKYVMRVQRKVQEEDLELAISEDQFDSLSKSGSAVSDSSLSHLRPKSDSDYSPHTSPHTSPSKSVEASPRSSRSTGQAGMARRGEGHRRLQPSQLFVSKTEEKKEETPKISKPGKPGKFRKTRVGPGS